MSGPPITTAGRPISWSASTRGIVVPQVDDEHPVDPMLAEPAPVDLDLLLDGVDELQRQADRAAARARASTPAMNSMKNGSSAIVVAGRARTSPHASAREAERARAARFGYHPSSSAMARIAVARLVRDAGSAVERVRNGSLRHACAFGDVLDRRPPPAASRPCASSPSGRCRRAHSSTRADD